MLGGIIPLAQYLFQQWNQASFIFIPPGVIQETVIPTTIPWIRSYYTTLTRSLERNRGRYKEMTASGFNCEISEEAFDASISYSYVDCFEIPIYLKEYYLPNWNLKIKDPAIEDWRSKQYDPERTGKLIASGSFLYSFIYDSEKPEEVISDHQGSDFSFFFMIGYRDDPYQAIEGVIRNWAKLAYPEEEASLFVFREDGEYRPDFSKDAKKFGGYKPYRRKKNATNELRQLFQYFVWCSTKKKQCLVRVNDHLFHVI